MAFSTLDRFDTMSHVNARCRMHRASLQVPSAASTVSGPIRPRYEAVLTPEALAFVADLVRTFRPRVERAARRAVASARPGSTRRAPRLPRRDAPTCARGDWTVRAAARRICSTAASRSPGPIDRKMVINALNSGASVFMADFEDANSPTWDNLVDGQINLGDAVRRTITLHGARDGQDVRAQREDRDAASCARAAGTSSSSTSRSTAQPMPGALFDFGLFFFHNAQGAARARHRARTSTCRRWRATSRRASGTTSSSARRSALGVPRGTIKATVPHRDAARRVRDGRDPLRAARALGGPQLRPLGLHLQLHQEARGTTRRPSCRTASQVTMDKGVPRGLRRSSSSRRATAAACTRWAGWRRRSRSRTTRPPTRRRSRRCAPTSCAR